jgi:hypothetical protein
MNKKEIIDKVINDLPVRSCRYEMTNNEWYGWFEEVYDLALKQGQSLHVHSVIECNCNNTLAKPISETEYECVNCGKEC